MIEKLRHRLTLLMTAMTALVLAGALLVTWRLSEKEYQTSAEHLFSSTFSSLCDRLIDAASVTDSWLAEQERGTGCFLFLQDNGSALHYGGALKGKTSREQLEKLALEEAVQVLDFSSRNNQGAVVQQEGYFTLCGNAKDYYFGAAALLPRGTKGEYLLLVSLQDKAFLAHHLQMSAVLYSGLWGAGCLLLALISHWLAGKALAPTVRTLRQQKEFIAAASHELRSPLAVIKASLQSYDDALPRERKAVLFHNIQSEADRMAHLTDDLLLLANGDIGNVPSRLENLAPDNVCIEIFDQMYPVAKQNGHVLTLQLPEDVTPEIQADRERLRQLIVILLRNAIEHTPSGTPIELIVTSKTPKGPLLISVTDHGPGIPEKEKAHIFERFYRADPSRTNKQNFGLGLSVAKELARLHSAVLTVQDTPGGGATFSLRFPVAAPK